MPVKAKKNRITLFIAGCSTLLPCVAPAQTALTVNNAAVGSNLYAFPQKITPDGTALTGYAQPALSFPNPSRRAFVWSLSGGVLDIGTLGGNWSDPMGISTSGSVVIGESALANGDRHAFRWTQAGMSDLGTLGGSESSAKGVSADGATVVGWADLSNGQSRAFKWTVSGGMTNLGTLAGGTYSYANAVSESGQYVTGYSGSTNGMRAYRWSSQAGMVDLGTLSGNYSIGRYISSDGAVIVGEAGVSGGGEHVFRWVDNSGMQDLGTLGGAYSYSRGLSADGSTVVGQSTLLNGNEHAFRWSQPDGMQNLGTLGGNYSAASAVSANGAVVVGDSKLAGNALSQGFRWTASTGMQSVEAWLNANGVAVAGRITNSATAVSSDGNVVVGYTKDNQAYIARVVPGANSNGGGAGGAGNGLVTVADVQTSLSGTAAGGSMALTSAGLSINGAHSRPLMRRVTAGQKTFWVAGDWGRDDHGSRSGSLGLAEMGGGYNFGHVQFNASLGQTWASQKLLQNGRTEAEGTYLQAEAIVPLAWSVWATLGAFHHQGNTELKRGYLNAGTQDYSSARPDTATTGVRARLDWDNALQIAGGQFSPYVDLSYAESRLDGYTETGGGFPARFDGRKESATEFRLGLSATKAIADSVALLGQLEGAHRFERHGARTTGQMIGLFGFDLPGSEIKQDWLRAGFGIQGKLVGGAAHVMINATTQGPVPNIWLAAGWQKSF